MEKKVGIVLLAVAAMVLLTLSACHKEKKYAHCPLVGHWGCEEYVSCRTDSFNCEYDYDSVSHILTIYNTSWIISQFTDATSADMLIEEVTANTLRSSWTNYFSEPDPFFERFFLKRID